MTTEEFILQQEFPKTGMQLALLAGEKGFRNLSDTLEQLVKNGKLHEIEYTIKGMEYRLKSIYFPMDWVIQTLNGNLINLWKLYWTEEMRLQIAKEKEELNL